MPPTMAGSMRMERVARQVQMALADVLILGLKDPRYLPVTVTHVRVSPDLRQADVRFMPLGQQGDADEICGVLNAASGYLQREVGRRIRMKFTPRFRFHVDTQGEEAMHMQALLSSIRETLGEE
jgi:ribosome-binding factor A